MSTICRLLDVCTAVTEPIRYARASGPSLDFVAEHDLAASLRIVYIRDRTHLVGLARWIVGTQGVAEELVQDTFVHLLERPPRLDNPAALGSYVQRAVVNRSRSRLRRLALERRHARREKACDPPRPVDDGGDPRLGVALRALPPRQRECVVLRFYADLTVAGIAEVLGISDGSVKTHLHRAMASLEAALNKGEAQ
ncbi:MAG: sigma-70 family RNA polymerase sigma factor [Actinomycetia bacterium]|nr:sigma-70 family RNA polymerase sigma factor [Actinomycetes bacterium]